MDPLFNISLRQATCQLSITQSLINWGPNHNIFLAKINAPASIPAGNGACLALKLLPSCQEFLSLAAKTQSSSCPSLSTKSLIWSTSRNTQLLTRITFFNLHKLEGTNSESTFSVSVLQTTHTHPFLNPDQTKSGDEFHCVWTWMVGKVNPHTIAIKMPSL